MSTPNIYSGGRGGGKGAGSPCDAAYPPVERYRQFITKLKKARYHVVSIPKGPAAYELGYRYVCIEDAELAYYQSKGAQLVELAP